MEDSRQTRVLTLVIGVLTAETITTSSAELINSLALPKEGIDEAMLCNVEDMVIVLMNPLLALESILDGI
jgi:hypothetical protein